MKIVLITSGQPSLNPRLVKEADTLVAAGYRVKVIYQYWNNWGTELDRELLKTKKWSFQLIGGSPDKQRLLYNFTRLQWKIGKLLVEKFGFKSWRELAIGRCTKQVIRAAENNIANLYIAHNLAALPAAALAAKKNNSKCGFDAEDFHRNEVTDNIFDYDFKLKKNIEDKYIKQLDYLSTASPLISLAYSEIYPEQEPVTILNAFPKQLITRQGSVDDCKLKLFWFSQTIGIGRGLEELIEALAFIKDYIIELHLLGNYDDQTKKSFEKISSAYSFNPDLIHYYHPIAPQKIFAFASQFDLGIASEISSPKNRDICLTNKIFTYIQSGLAVIASDTTAQKKLFEEYPDMGIVYKKNNPESLAAAIKIYIENRELLRKHQNRAYKYATETLNWEVEQEKFLSIVKYTLEN
ncbi:glycosyltransferase family protein [Pedobacter rhodius]|uniref:Glycosyltransferase n=1 Tax=Pedobacter rhodius TaxID=3004098 RepID=A0ABT4KS95_9SPHI|nr:glycosyltransferase [Pedobacter sp. SJ11]MCZ4221794.1 glycosyltransferase [Pedobacter sp. SJ11]